MSDRDALANHGWILVEEAAKASGISQRTLRRWIQMERLPSIRVSGRRYIRPRHLQVLLRDETSMA